MIAIVFDTETIDLFRLDMFDFGFQVINTDTKEVLEEGSFLIDGIYNTPFFKEAYCYNMNKEKYEDKLKRGIIQIKTLLEVRKIFNEAIVKHKVDTIAGFVIDFDIRVLNFNFKKYLDETREITKESLSKKFEVVDIGVMFSVFQQKHGSYIEECIEQRWLTAKGYISATAEIIYRYISGDYSHIEEHTALNDVIEESQILQYTIDNFKQLEDFNSLYELSKKYTITGKKPWQILKK